jgi:transposase
MVKGNEVISQSGHIAFQKNPAILKSLGIKLKSIPSCLLQHVKELRLGEFAYARLTPKLGN